MRKTEILLVVAGIGLCGAIGVGQAPQAPAQGRGGAPQPQPVVPTAVTVLTTTPDKFIGTSVSLTAAVEQRYGATAFSIDQSRTKTGPDLLVLAPVLTAPVEPNAYVTVIGEVIRFDVATAAARMKDAMPPLSPEVVDKYRGKPAIIATSVINNAMTDLAKRLPPPMTPEEEALSKLMKQIGPGFNALRQAVTASNAEDVKTQAATLNKAFTEAAAFWKKQPHADAIQWTEDARRESDAIAAAAAKNDMDAVKAAVPKLQSACASCHGSYRERLDDGTYRYKQTGK
jgi:cytochrome c556